MSIADDGVGGETGSDGLGPPLSTGMRGLTERVRAAGGTVTVDVEPGRGRRVSAWVPLPLPGPTAPRDAEPTERQGGAVGDRVVDEPLRSPVGGGPAAR